MIKRIFDIVFSSVGLILFAPIILIFCCIIWFGDYKSPLFLGYRAGRYGVKFKMVKLRSMVKNAEKIGIESTRATDIRITPIGVIIRRYKLDELSQLWNVLIGDMSLVGPRPNTLKEVAKYTTNEKKLLTVRPGITDISSVVFSDEGDILEAAADPELAYDLLIRPWKSQLGILYIEHRNIFIDLYLIFITFVSIVNKKYSLTLVARLLSYMDAPDDIKSVCLRNSDLNSPVISEGCSR